MNDISCPHCGKAFKVDESGYGDILKQVRDHEFDRQLQERLALAEREKQDALALVKSKIDNEMQKAASAKDAEIAALKSEVERAELTKTLAISEALSAVEKQRDQLGNRLEVAELEKAISEKAL